MLATESNDFCCGNGRRTLPRLTPWPPRFEILKNDNRYRTHLGEYSRSINNLFTFAGIGVTGGFTNFSHAIAPGPPAIAITGRTYHLIRDTEYSRHSIHWFLYDEQSRRREAEDFGAHATVVQAITDDLNIVNPYVHQLHRFHGLAREHQLTLELKDFASNQDFAAVLHGTSSTAIHPRSIVIRRHGHCQPEFVNILSHHYEPLHYVLFFPHADIGWGLSAVQDVPQLSQIDWYHSRLLANDDERFTTLGRLCCEYLVDMYSRTEEERLSYILREQRHQQQEEQHDEENIDEDIKLPASFVGSQAWTSEQTADAMALGRKFGKPTFFGTMTFNPDWPEVRAQLRPGQTATDIPVVVARTFKARLEKVLHLIRTRFGTKVYLVKVVEFQKRGFPHAHMVLKVSVVTSSIQIKSNKLFCPTGSPRASFP